MMMGGSACAVDVLGGIMLVMRADEREMHWFAAEVHLTRHQGV